MLKVFLSHNSADKPKVENIGQRLRESGFNPRLDKWDMPAGDRWQEWLERELISCDACLIFFGKQGWGSWHDAEMRVALDRGIGKKNLRIIPVLLPDAPQEAIAEMPLFLRAYNAVQFRALADKDAFARLVAGIRGEALGSNIDMDNLPDPYRGLQVFDIEHAPFFFGREVAKATLLQQISQTLMPAFGSESLPRFLALVGASGSGKSSLARAGLLASLKNGALPNSQNWPQLLFKPGEKPLQSLAIAINAHTDWRGRCSTSELIEKFCQHPLQLHYLALELLHGIENCYVLILVDQFEELFTLCKDRTIQQAFLDNLLNAATDPTGKVFVLLTLRSDFYTHCTNFPNLSRLLEARQHIVNPLSEQELQQAIELPARQVGSDFELGLRTLMVKDAQEQPGTLPLLQYALTQLWEQRKTRILRLQDYQAFGGLAGALEQRANQLYGNFSVEAKEQCRLVFRRLVQPGEGTVDTRRRSRLDEFGENESMHQVIRYLTDARLLTTQRTEETAFVEVSHEALIRGWSQLREWVNADRDQLRLQHQVSSAAQEWEQHGRANAWLWTGSRLAAAEEWSQAYPADVNTQELQFINAGVRQRDAAKLEEQKRQQQLKVFAVGAFLLFLVALSGGLMAVRSANEAVQAREMAQQNEEQAIRARKLAEQNEEQAKVKELEANYHLAKVFEEKANALVEHSKQLHAGDPEYIGVLRQAFLYGLEAQRQPILSGENSITTDTISRLAEIDISWLTPERRKKMAEHASVTYSPDAKVIAGHADEVVNLRDAITWKTLKNFEVNGMIRTIKYSPDGKVLAISSDSATYLWDVETNQLLRSLEPGIDVAFKPVTNVLANATWDKGVQVLDVGTGHLPSSLNGNTDEVRALTYSPDGKVLATAMGKILKLWDTETGQLLHSLEGHQGDIRTLVYSPDGRSIGSAGADNTIRLWDANGQLLHSLEGHKMGISALAYSPDSRVLASGSSDNTIRLWDTETGVLLRGWEVTAEAQSDERGYYGGVESIMYSPDGSVIVSNSTGDDIMQLWDTDTLQPKILQGEQYGLNVRALARSPDGSVVLSVSSDGTMRLWDTLTGEMLKTLKNKSSMSSVVAYNPDGKVMVQPFSGGLYVLDALTGEELNTLALEDYDNFKEHGWGVKSISYSPEGQVIALLTNSSVLRLWNVSTGKTIKIWRGLDQGKTNLSYSPTGTALYGVNSFAFAPNSKVVAIGDNKSIHLFDIETGEFLKTLYGHNENVITAIYSTDGKAIVSGSENETIIWDTERAQPAIKVSIGSSTLVYGSNTIVLLDLHSDTLRFLKLSSMQLLHNFDPAEVADALKFLWGLRLDGFMFVADYENNYENKATEKYRSLLDTPRPNETKIDQLIRWLEERKAYRKTPAGSPTP